MTTTDTKTAAHWLDILPALPLAKGVPVMHLHFAREYTALHHGPNGWACHDGGRASSPFPEADLRVDLYDPQGFGYALRYACQHCDPAISYLWPAMASRWMRGETTGTDRLALAQALAEVM